MPHLSKKFPLFGHQDENTSIRTAYMDADILSGSETSEGNICEEGGDCADRVNAEDYEQDGEARQILQDAKRVAESRRKRVT